MPDVKRTVNIITEQHELPDEESGVAGFPQRAWNMSVWLVDANGNDVPAKVFSKVTYILHESFGARAKQVKTEPPFQINEKGWGEFDVKIILTTIEKGGDQTLLHDLNFYQNRYVSSHSITFKNPKPTLMGILRESGPVPGDENGKKKDDGKKKTKKKMGVDMDTLAERLEGLGEDDLLHVVQMIHDGKTNESYTKNDIDAGEFHVDLYTLPDTLLTSLWEFAASKQP